MNREEQIREAVAKFDVVTGPRIVAALQRVVDVWPGVRSLFEIDAVIAAIKKQQAAAREGS